MRLLSDEDIIDGQRGHTRATPSDERLHSRLHVRRGFRVKGRAQSNIKKAAASYVCV